MQIKADMMADNSKRIKKVGRGKQTKILTVEKLS